MHLVYNIYLEVAGCFFLAVLLIYSWLTVEGKNRSNREFKVLVMILLTNEILDIATAITISYGAVISPGFNMVLNTIYFLFTAAGGYQAAVYIESYVEKIPMKLKISRVNFIAGIIYGVLLLCNMFGGYIFHFDEAGSYVHGILYPVVFLCPMYFMTTAVILNIRHPQAFTKKQFISNLVYALIVFSASAVQAFFLPSILLTCFSGSLAIMIVFFSLETPDYQNLMKTMEELKRSKEETEFAEAEAIAANQAKSHFLANMSHEIRTPINGILGMNTLIIEETKDPAILEYALNVQSAGNSLLSIVNDILDFSRIESGKTQIIEGEYQLCSLLNDCYNLIYLKANEKNLSLKFENDPDMPAVLYGDEVRIRQIIMNLLTNAVKYTPKGSVTLRAGYQNDDDDNIVLYIAVEDSGIGIDKDNQYLLFETFERIDESVIRNIEGTGLGLVITKQLLEMMGGNIQVESELQKGSVFTVAIPQRVVSRKAAGEFTPKYTEATTISRGNPYEFIAPEARILVVDDVEMNIRVVKGMLRKTGIHVETARNGIECLAKAQEKQYDVILLDHMMPEMDGVETLHKMKDLDRNKNKNTPVIMLTANAILGARENYLVEGFTDYLSKPVLERQLYKVMLKYLPERLVKRGEVLKEKVSDEASREFTAIGDEKLDQLTCLDLETGLAYCANDIEFYKEMLDTYLENEKTLALKQHFGQKQWKDYAIVIHGVKSSSLTIGAIEVSQKAKELEHAAKDCNEEFILQNHDAFIQMYQGLIDTIASVIKE